jgi:hypothetical protein
MAILGRDILSSRTLKTVTIEVPEWEGAVILRQLTGDEVSEVQEIALKAMDQGTQTVKDGKALMRFRATVVCFAWVDEDGNQVMQRSDIPALMKQSYTVLDHLADAAEELTGLNQKALEAAKKNSQTNQSDDSGSS